MFHYKLPFHKLYLYKTTLKHKKLCSKLLKMTKPEMPEKSQKQMKQFVQRPTQNLLMALDSKIANILWDNLWLLEPD